MRKEFTKASSEPFDRKEDTTGDSTGREQPCNTAGVAWGGVQSSVLNWNCSWDKDPDWKMGMLHLMTTEGNQGAEKQLRLPTCFFCSVSISMDNEQEIPSSGPWLITLLMRRLFVSLVFLYFCQVSLAESVHWGCPLISTTWKGNKKEWIHTALWSSWQDYVLETKTVKQLLCE